MRTARAIGAFAVAVLLAAAPLAAFAADGGDRTLRDPRIDESSGLAVSTLHPGVLYTHNDSGDGPRVFAVARDGSTAAVLTLRGAQARDWEAMSPGRAGSDTIWVGDIGDNITAWGTYRVYRFAEPKTLKDQDVAWTGYELAYADGKSHNAESLMIHPKTGRLYVVTKNVMGNALYEAPATLSTTKPNLLTKIAGALPYATDAAFSPDGKYYVVRGYVDAAVYATADPGKRVAHVDLPPQPQGESIAWSADGASFYVGSEGVGSLVQQVAVPPAIVAAEASASPTASSTATATTTPDPGDVVGPSGGDTDSGGLPRAQVLWIGAGALVLIALGLSLRAWGRHDPDEA